MDKERIISIEEARELLEPYKERIATCIRAGWERWEELGIESPMSQLPLRPSTRASFVYDEFQMQLPGMPPEATSLVAGYLLDDVQTSIDLMAVTCVDGPALESALDITDAGDADETTVEPIRSPQPSGPRIRPKAPAEADEDEASGGR